MSEYTEGPWDVDEENVIFAFVGDERKHIASVWDADTYAENQANARLMAAAPGLFEALENLVDHMAGEQEDYDELDKAYGLQGLGVRFARARKAVALARSE